MKTVEAHNAELTGRITFLQMPPIPEEALEFIEEAQKAAERISGEPQVLTDVPAKRRQGPANGLASV